MQAENLQQHKNYVAEQVNLKFGDKAVPMEKVMDFQATQEGSVVKCLILFYSPVQSLNSKGGMTRSYKVTLNTEGGLSVADIQEYEYTEEDMEKIDLEEIKKLQQGGQ